MDKIDFVKFQVNEEQRSIVFSCCSNNPYTRFDEETKVIYDEILVIDENTVDLSRLNNSAPLLYNHDVDKLIGVVDKAWILDEKVYVKVRFSANDSFADRLYKDVLDGLIKNISIGYQIEDYEDKTIENRNIRYITKWLIYQCSIVSIPADDSIGIRKLNIKDNSQMEIEKEDIIEEKEIVAEEKEDIVEDEKEIVAEDEIKKLKQENEQLKQRIEELEKVEEKEEIVEEQQTEEINADQEEIKKIGEDFQIDKEEIKRAIENKLTVREFTAKIKTFNIRNNKKMNEKREFVDYIQKRDYSKPFVLRSFDGFGGKTGENGAAAIATEKMSIVKALQMVMGVKGFTTLSGLTSNVSIPCQTGRITADYADDLRSAVAVSAPTLTDKILTPTKISATTVIGRELLTIANDDIISFIVDDITKSIALKVEALLLNKVAEGAGTTITYSALNAVDYADIVAFESAVADYAVGGLNWVMGAGARGVLKTIPLDNANGASGRFICENNEINGYGVNVSAVAGATNGALYFGDWSKLLVGFFGNDGGASFVIDEYTLSHEGNIRVTGNVFVDACLTNSEAFAVGKVQ